MDPFNQMNQPSKPPGSSLEGLDAFGIVGGAPPRPPHRPSFVGMPPSVMPGNLQQPGMPGMPGMMPPPMLAMPGMIRPGMSPSMPPLPGSAGMPPMPPMPPIPPMNFPRGVPMPPMIPLQMPTPGTFTKPGATSTAVPVSIDPFAILGGQKLQPTVPPSGPNVSLNDLQQQQKQQQEQQLQQQNQVYAQTSSVADDLDFLSLAGKPQAATSKTFQQTPAVSSIGIPDDLDIFSSPKPAEQPALKIAAPSPVVVDESNSFGFPDNFTPLATPGKTTHAAVIDDDDDVFNPKPQPPKAPPQPPLPPLPRQPQPSAHAAAASSSDPFAAPIVDPFAAPGRSSTITSPSSDPFTPSSSDPFAPPIPSSDPFRQQASPSNDPFAAPIPTVARPAYPVASNPFTAGGGTNPFTAGEESTNSYGSGYGSNPFGQGESLPRAQRVAVRGVVEDDDGYDQHDQPQATAAAAAVGNFPRPDLDSEPARDLSDLPSEGSIMARISTRSMFAKDWAQMYWVMDKDDLYLYRSKEDYLRPTGIGYKKKVHITFNLRCLKIHRKEYSGYGSLLNFMLEEYMDYGPTNVAKFASTDREEIEGLYEHLKAKIQQKRRLRGF